MKLRKWSAFLLTVLLLLPTLMLPASAAGDPVLNYEVTIDGLDTKEAEVGDIVTVTLHLQRTDADEPYTMYAMQSELRYDSSFFELVEDSTYLYDGVNSTDIAVGGGLREFYMNFVSFSGGVTWQARTRVGSFQLRVIGTEGVSTITNEDFLVSNPNGQSSYECESNVLTVILTTDCTVKFETNGGTKIDPVTAIYGERLERPEDPTREGKHLVGWYKDIHLTDEWNFETDAVTGNMTLYAKWADGEPSQPGEDDDHEKDPAGDGSCMICGRTCGGFFGIALCWLCLLLILLLVLLMIYFIYRYQKKRRDAMNDVERKNETTNKEGENDAKQD